MLAKLPSLAYMLMPLQFSRTSHAERVLAAQTRSVCAELSVKGDSSHGDGGVHSTSCESPPMHLARSQIPRACACVCVSVRVSLGEQGPTVLACAHTHTHTDAQSGLDDPCMHSVF